ncbi:hypothetical protein NHX12_005761 [Muraenolepis orangiensis]|uniref:Uncharacterized protein n=1 Tax=Muraenolepis orangiensis TaxID=630683 RepID=A0A9Q0IE08_9TELE|nr:hypothetical protein NHX12_005761 [Muraenolepis orangiensis]
MWFTRPCAGSSSFRGQRRPPWCARHRSVAPYLSEVTADTATTSLSDGPAHGTLTSCFLEVTLAGLT